MYTGVRLWVRKGPRERESSPLDSELAVLLKRRERREVLDVAERLARRVLESDELGLGSTKMEWGVQPPEVSWEE